MSTYRRNAIIVRSLFIFSTVFLFADCKVAPMIDKSFPLSETADAFRYYGEGCTKGKVLITMEDEL